MSVPGSNTLNTGKADDDDEKTALQWQLLQLCIVNFVTDHDSVYFNSIIYSQFSLYPSLSPLPS
jgi:hypothetical protein